MSGDREMDDLVLKGMAGSEGGGTPTAAAAEEDTTMEDGEERE